MSDKTDISPEARAQQHINDALRKKGKDIPGAHEISELIQDELDVELSAFKKSSGMNDEQVLDLWMAFVKYLAGRPLSQNAIETLVRLSGLYSSSEIVAVVDDISTSGGTISFDVVAEKPDLRINWRVTDV